MRPLTESSRFKEEIDPLIEAVPAAKDRAFINDGIQWFFGAATRDVTGVATGPRGGLGRAL